MSGLKPFDTFSEFGSGSGGCDAHGVGGPVDEARDFCGFEGVLVAQVKEFLYGWGEFFQTGR